MNGDSIRCHLTYYQEPRPAFFRRSQISSRPPERRPTADIRKLHILNRMGYYLLYIVSYMYNLLKLTQVSVEYCIVMISMYVLEQKVVVISQRFLAQIGRD